MREVTVWYLESRSRTDLKPAADPGNIEIREAKIKQFQVNRFLYQWIGATWEWADKLVWSDEQWQAYAETENLRTWIAWSEGSPAGFFELQMQAEDCVEIAYFGLAGRFLGRGMGGYLLTEAIRKAWDWGASRVRVNTCSLDHASALSNYQARGFSIYETEVERRA
jgi:GNAT superfamily N-acetyltransferase